MGKLKKIDWDYVDSMLKKSIVIDPELGPIHPRVQKAMDDYPCWRFYTDSNLKLCVFRVLGVYPPDDIDTNPDFVIKLIAASLPPNRNEDLRVDVLPIDDFLRIDEWSSHHVKMIMNHQYGTLFKEPTGFIEIQKGLNSLVIANEEDGSNEEKVTQ